MRVYRLLQVALQAETLRWKSMASRIVARIVFACMALLFLVGVLIFAHVAAWVALRSAAGLNHYGAAGILAGVDLLIALICLFLANRSAPSRTELEALEVRRRAVHSMGTALSIGQLALPLLRLANNMLRRSRT